MDSGAEKEVIRIAFPYLDFFIVQDYSAATNLFTFFKQPEPFSFSDAFEHAFQSSTSELDQLLKNILVDLKQHCKLMYAYEGKVGGLPVDDIICGVNRRGDAHPNRSLTKA